MELNRDKNNVMFLELINLLIEKIDEEKELFRELGNDINDKEYEALCRLDEVVDTPFTKRIVDYMRFYFDMDNSDYAKLYIACTRNVYLVYLSFLQEFIDDKDMADLRKGILSYKYYNSFICHDVEYSNIVNKFSIERDNYIDLYMKVGMLKLDKNEVDKIINECLLDTVSVSIKNIMSISDKEYDDSKKKIISINSQCMLKAGLSMFSEKEYMLIKDKISLMMNDLCNEKNSVSMDLISNIINDRVKNKSRIKKLSFGLVEE